MESKSKLKKEILPFSLILIASVFRLIPHPPNFTPLTAIALFGGATFENRILAIFVPFFAMLISDAIIGFHSTMWAVYISFGLIALVGGAYLRKQNKFKNILIATLASSFSFYLITNFAVWLTSGMYPHTIAGLIQCYIFGLPFYRTTTLELFGISIVGDLVFTLSLFGAYKLAEKMLPSTLRKY
jgi:hypothetical protein